MQHDRLANADLPRTVSNLLGHLSDLIRKEIRLARAELSQMLAAKLQATIWAAVAAIAALLAAIMILETAVFALVAFGLATPWACLLVAVILGAGAGLALLRARGLAKKGPGAGDLVGHVARDIHMVKERLT